MKKIFFSLTPILFFCVAFAQIPDPCTGAGASQTIHIASPCNCAEAQSGASCNKSIFSTQALSDAAINNFLTTQSGYGQPTTPVAWQDVRASNMLLNGTGIVKHEFSTEFTTGPTTSSVSVINICQVKNTCDASCQDYKIILKSGGACNTNLLTPTLIPSVPTGSNPIVNYRQYNVAPNTTYIITRQIYYDGTSAGCFTGWTGTDGSASGGAKITSQHWFIWSTGGVLPLNSIKVFAKQFNNAVMLQWQTLQENNVARFEIEKSTDGNNFKKIDDALAKGNATSQTNYWVEDKVPSAINYYRIKTIDVDGKTSLSSVIKYVLQDNIKASVIISPNPVVNNADIYFECKTNGIASYSIFSTTGNSIITGKISVQKGMNKVSQNVSGLAAGTYLFLLNSGGGTVSVKFVKG